MTIIPSVTAELVTGTDEQAQLPFWEWRSDILSVRFVQRLPTTVTGKVQRYKLREMADGE